MKEHIPYKYNIHKYLTDLGVEQGNDTKLKAIELILAHTNASPSKFRNYRYAKVGEGQPANCISIADMRAVVGILNDMKVDSESLQMEDMYHEAVINEELHAHIS